MTITWKANLVLELWCFKTQLLIIHYWHTLSYYIHWSNTQKSGSNFNEVTGLCACSTFMSVSQDDRHESLHFAFVFCILHTQIETLPHTHRSQVSNKNLPDQRQGEHKGAAGQARKAWSPSSSTIPAGIVRISGYNNDVTRHPLRAK